MGFSSQVIEKKNNHSHSEEGTKIKEGVTRQTSVTGLVGESRGRWEVSGLYGKIDGKIKIQLNSRKARETHKEKVGILHRKKIKLGEGFGYDSRKTRETR